MVVGRSIALTVFNNVKVSDGNAELLAEQPCDPPDLRHLQLLGW